MLPPGVLKLWVADGGVTGAAEVAEPPLPLAPAAGLRTGTRVALDFWRRRVDDGDRRLWCLVPRWWVQLSSGAVDSVVDGSVVSGSVEATLTVNSALVSDDLPGTTV